jgi:formylglycine-generating enzyme required for sulfatase activity
VGAHSSGDTPSGIHDLAGNVAEWVTTPDDDAPENKNGVVLGGSYETALATELRTWERRVINAAAREKTIGFRCAYDLP